MLAKVIAHAPTRDQAASVLALALERLHLGGVVTNRDFLVATLRHQRFLSGDTTTAFIDRYEPARTLALDGDELMWAASAGALWLAGENRANAPVLSMMPSGWRNARLPRQRTSLRFIDCVLDIDYASRRDGSFNVGDGTARVLDWSPTTIDVEVNGRRARSRVTHAKNQLYVQTLRGHRKLRDRAPLRRPRL